MAKFQSILETIGNTPVVRINKLAPEGVNLFVKIEAFNPLHSVKDRLALGVIEAAEKSGALKPGQTVTRGQRYGLVRFGARLEVYLPVTAVPRVAPGDRVSATTSILASLQPA